MRNKSFAGFVKYAVAYEGFNFICEADFATAKRDFIADDSQFVHFLCNHTKKVK